MPTLVTPTTSVHVSFLAAMAEFEAEGRGPGDGSMIGGDLGLYGPRWSTAEGFAEYVAAVVDQARPDAPRPAHHVPSTTLWWVEGDEFLGRIAVRHRLTPGLIEVGGHIGYDVRRCARGRGHATAMLRMVLPVANRLGIAPAALLTCDEDNIASRRVIEHNGGRLEDQRGHSMRFWVPTTA